ncbi:MAG: phosphoribosylglycinamide formyltransferase [Bdellovibrionia bacterium]
MIPIAVLASGRGSNFGAVFEAIQTKKLDAEIVAVISDQPQAPVLQSARERGLKAILIPAGASGKQSGASERSGKGTPLNELAERRRIHEEKILAELLPLGPKFLVLAGYMRILTPLLIDSFRCDRGYSRMVNIHPSLLPAFPGVHSYSQAFRYGVKWTGVTVHFVENAVDSGPICAQEAFSIADCRSEAEVEARGLAVEHRLLPEALKWILPENFTLENRESRENRSEGRFCVCPN